MYIHKFVPLEDCPLHLSSKWGRVIEDSPPVDMPSTQELRERRDARIRDAIDTCVEGGGTIMDLVFNSRIPAGALLAIWAEEIGRVEQYQGRDLTIKYICKLRRIHRKKE